MNIQILFFILHSYRFVDKVSEGVKDIKATLSIFSICYDDQ